jgi:hypothetical protein
MADLGMTVDEITARLAAQAGYSSPTTDQEVQCVEWLNEGMRRVIRGAYFDGRTWQTHRWSWLYPSYTLAVGAAGSAVNGDGTASTNTVTSDSALFDESMAGLSISVDGLSDDLTIESVVSSTEVVVTSLDSDFADKDITPPRSGIVALPADFGGIATEVVHQRREYGRSRLSAVSREQIVSRWSHNVGWTGHPIRYTIVPVDATGDRYEMWVEPRPDETYYLHVGYRVRIDKVAESAAGFDDTSSLTGPPEIHELFLLGARAAAERAIGRSNNVYEERFNDEMAACVQFDVNTHTTSGHAESYTDLPRGDR